MTKNPAERTIQIKAPDIRTMIFSVTGTAPYVQNRFANKAEYMAKQAAGTDGKAGKKKPPKEFEKLFENAKHLSSEGWCGIPAASFRAAMISACRLANFKMTIAKLSVFVLADGLDQDGSPIVRIIGDEPEMTTMFVRNDTGVPDVRARPMWRQWGCKLRVQYDAEQFNESDLANLMMRAGLQVGIGEGRPDSKKSAGMGWGTFSIEGAKK